MSNKLKSTFLTINAINANICKANTEELNVSGTISNGDNEYYQPAVVGSLLIFAANNDNAYKKGYLLCNGAAISRTTYSKLFEIIGTLYGSGDGSTTFNLPNLNNNFIQGSATAGTSKAAGLPNITGGFSSVKLESNAGTLISFSGAFAASGSGGMGISSGGGGSGYYKSTTFNASKSNAIYGKSTTVQPPAVTMRIYIKY